jgi:hypothetical protein
LAGAEAVSHRDKLSTGALLARFLGLACFDDRSVEPRVPHFQVAFTDVPSLPRVVRPFSFVLADHDSPRRRDDDKSVINRSEAFVPRGAESGGDIGEQMIHHVVIVCDQGNRSHVFFRIPRIVDFVKLA